MHRRTLRRLTTASAASLAMVAALATATTSTADTSPASTSPAAAQQPTAAARAAGITGPGQAYMGWSHHGTPPSSTVSKPVSQTLTAAQTWGMDVASYQGNVDWTYWYNAGMRFAYVKATEGTTYTNPYFSQQYGGSYNVGMIRGAYHFALPANSGGSTQADAFIANGGGWSADGKTLPGALDIEYNPYGATCYGLSQASMVSWIKAFTDRYKYRTGRDPVIYSTTDWWTTCTGNSTAFNTTNPLWVARYASTVGALPGGWPTQTIWQYTSDGGMDKNYFNGDLSRVQALALG